MAQFGAYLNMFITICYFAAVAVVGRAVFGAQARLEGYSFSKAAFEDNNPAVTVRFCGLMAALFVAAYSAYAPAGQSVLADLSNGGYALVIALIVILVSRWVNDHLILGDIDNEKAVVTDRNVAVAIVESAAYVSTAFIFAGGMTDSTHGLLNNLVWFVIGQAILVAIGMTYRLLSPVVFKNVETGNVACALTLAGVLLSGGIAMGGAIRGEFAGWAVDLPKVALSLVIWLVLMAVVWVASQIVVVGRSRFLSEVTTDGNWAVGLLQGIFLVSMTAAFVGVHG